MPKCQVCDGDSFDLIDGHYYCSTCQTQTQDIREEEFEDETFYASARSYKQIKTTQVGAKKEKVDDKGRPWETPEAFQLILKLQIKKLIELGANPKLEDVVFQLWLRYLSKSGIAFCSEEKKRKSSHIGQTTRDRYGTTLKNPEVRAIKGWRTMSKRGNYSSLPKALQNRRNLKFQRSLRAITGEEPSAFETEEFYEDDDPNLLNDDENFSEDIALMIEEDSNSSEEEDVVEIPDGYEMSSDEELPVSSPRRRGTKKDARVLDRMCMRWTLSLCFLGLLHTRSVSLASDLLGWVRDGTFPYRRAADLLPEDFKFYLTDRVMLYHVAIPSNKRLRVDTGRMAQYLGVQNYPQPNIMLFVSRYILELKLPSEFHGYVCTLLRKFPLSLVHRDKSTEKSNYLYVPNYEGIAVVYIIIVLKILFGVDGQSERQLSSVAHQLQDILHLDPPLFVWKKWEEQMYYKHRKRLKYTLPTCTREAEEIEDVKPVMEHYQKFVHNTCTVQRSRTYRVARYKQVKFKEPLAKPFHSMMEEFERNLGGVTYTARLPSARSAESTSVLRDEPTLASESFDLSQDLFTTQRPEEDIKVVDDTKRHSVKFLIDSDFVEHISNRGTVTMSRKEVQSHDWTVVPSGKKKAKLDPQTLLQKHVSQRVKESVKEILHNRPVPHEDYKIYKSLEDSPDSYKFLIELASTKLSMKSVQLHELLKLTECKLFKEYSDLDIQEKKAFERLRYFYFNKKGKGLSN